MSHRVQLEYFVLRYVPNVVRGEFVNIGLAVFASGDEAFAEVRFVENWDAVLALDPDADLVVLDAFAEHLRRRFRVREDRDEILRSMTDTFSNIIQLAEFHVCLSEHPLAELDRLCHLYL
jgi:Protein of unknown function (DUF3037)